MPLEPVLRNNLLTLFTEFQAARGGTFGTISVRVSGDSGFYDKLASGLSLFSVWRYDVVVANFSNLWPDDLAWPEGVERTDLNQIQPRPKRKGTKASA